ncbi:MAG: TIGR04282 family arsenosugar biosynthesis glycosyltransferase [Candidatus Promineifilaceae bacterium]
MNRAIVIMAKRPEAGRTKTRLCPPLTLEDSAELYAAFLQDTVDHVRSLPNITPCIAYAPADAEPFFHKLAPDFLLIPQTGSTLGDRLNNVINHCLEAGFDQVAPINSDSPNLPTAYFTNAFEQLSKQSVDVVLGPCEDGGYYLIGVKASHPPLVRDVEMSTPYVLRDTLTIAKQLGLRVQLCESWYDVDSAQELERLKNNLKTTPDYCPNTWQALSPRTVETPR